jgi:WhiB family redox-sensing transcriptional regulator
MSWFPAAGEKPNRQIAICERCTVRAECLEAAMTNVERFGVWGGSSAAARVRVFVAAA